MNAQVELINSILEQSNIDECTSLGVETSMGDYQDVWVYVRNFYHEYKVLPTKQIVKKEFGDRFDSLKVDMPLAYYVDEAKKVSLASNIRTSLSKAVDVLKNSGPEAALKFLSANSNKLARSTGVLRDTDLVGDAGDRIANFRERYESPSHIMGIPSGIGPIDNIFGGFQGGDFVVLMGWSGQRKSWTGMLLAVNAWKAGYKTLIFSLELPKNQMGYRFDTLANAGETFRNSDLMHGRSLSPDDYEAWAEREFKDKPPVYLVTAEGMEAPTQYTVQSKIEQYSPDFILLDYHQLFDDGDGGGTETEKAKNLSKAFKRLAVSYDVPILDITAVTMKNREYSERPPELDEVAWTKQLAYDADLVLAVYNEPDSNTFQVVSRKNRRGPDFGFYLDWDIDSGRWSERFSDV